VRTCACGCSVACRMRGCVTACDAAQRPVQGISVHQTPARLRRLRTPTLPPLSLTHTHTHTQHTHTRHGTRRVQLSAAAAGARLDPGSPQGPHPHRSNRRQHHKRRKGEPDRRDGLVRAALCVCWTARARRRGRGRG
jgi:hypothetical protein